MTENEIIIKLLLACFFGGIIGYLREKERKAAGLRTHIMVSMGAALFMLISIYMSLMFAGADASRIASSVVVGIGFIGAGAIIREGGTVRGLTTASSVWAAAAIGLALGCGMYMTAITATILAFIILQVLSVVERKYIYPSRKQ